MNGKRNTLKELIELRSQLHIELDAIEADLQSLRSEGETVATSSETEGEMGSCVTDTLTTRKRKSTEAQLHGVKLGYYKEIHELTNTIHTMQENQPAHADETHPGYALRKIDPNTPK